MTGQTLRGDYVLISPCRDEARRMRRTLDSVAAQTVLPALWLIVDDGSTDGSAGILDEYAAAYDWIRVITRADRGRRLVGPAVVDAFYEGMAAIEAEDFAFVCKLDLDLELPPGYFARLMALMAAEPRLGICSGKPYHRGEDGVPAPEPCGDEMAVGMSKFYRVACFRQIGGLVREVMWDAIDCHKARSLGWIVRSFDEPSLRFEHLRPIGASQSGLLEGRRRHGFGQHFMGTHWLFFLASAIYRLAQSPVTTGSLAMLAGFFGAKLRGAPQLQDRSLIRFIKRYQLRALLVGKKQATREFESARAPEWRGEVSATEPAA